MLSTVDDVESWTNVASRKQRREKENANQIFDKIRGGGGDSSRASSQLPKTGGPSSQVRTHGWTIKARDQNETGTAAGY